MIPLLRPSRGVGGALRACRHSHSTTISSTTKHPFSTSPRQRQSSPRIASFEEIAALAKHEQHRLSLGDLIKHGRPPLSEAALLSSANFTLSLLPIRLARRLWAFRSLPFCVVDNPNISWIHRNYQHSLSTLLPWLESSGNGGVDDGAGDVNSGWRIRTLEEETRFTETLAELVKTHANTIPILAKGFLESKCYASNELVTKFLNEHLRARIGTRLIAEQHLSLHDESVPQEDASARDSHDKGEGKEVRWIGVIDTAFKPLSMVRSCAESVANIAELRYGVRPTVEVNGELDTTFAFVPGHLEYILMELFKNAFRATVENDSREPVIVTIAPEPPTPESQRVDGLHAAARANKDGIIPLGDNAPGVTIRIRDRGGGIPPDVLPKVWNYSFTTVSEDEQAGIFSGVGGGIGLDALTNASAGGSSMAGLGYGLPLGRAYAEYFGGGITLQSLPGWGTDVYLRLKGLGNV